MALGCPKCGGRFSVVACRACSATGDRERMASWLESEAVPSCPRDISLGS
jgi:hypothetical protein